MSYKTLEAAREIGICFDSGVAVFRVLQAHGINHFERRGPDGKMIEMCGIERMIDEMIQARDRRKR